MQRSDLPKLAFTREPDGTVHLLIDGKAVMASCPNLPCSHLHEVDINDDHGWWHGPAWVLYLPRERGEYSLPEVAWSTLGEIAAAEGAAKVTDTTT